MSSGQPGSRTYRVTAHGPAGQTADAGVVAIDAGQRIAIVAAEPRFADMLELAVETLNETETFMIRTAPPEDAAPLTLHKRLVARTDADAAAVLLELLRRDYALELIPAG